MSRQWKSGDVAAVTLPDGTEALAVRSPRPQGKGDYWQHSGKYGAGSMYDDIGGLDATLRPLVVIDPENGTDVKRLIKAVMAHGYERPPGRGDMQAALRSLIVPEKPAEPTGLGAVVEVPSRLGDTYGVRLLVRGHSTHQPWMGDGIKQDWDEIEGPVKVLSEGVTQ